MIFLAIIGGIFLIVCWYHAIKGWWGDFAVSQGWYDWGTLATTLLVYLVCTPFVVLFDNDL